MRIDVLEADSRLVWQCVQGPWPGHTLSFEIEPTIGKTVITVV